MPVDVRDRVVPACNPVRSEVLLDPCLEGSEVARNEGVPEDEATPDKVQVLMCEALVGASVHIGESKRCCVGWYHVYTLFYRILDFLDRPADAHLPASAELADML